MVTNIPDGSGYTATSQWASAHTKVLKLNTEGAILTNNLAGMDALGSGVYVDQMVRFVCQDGTTVPTVCTTTDTGIKLAVFASAASSLVVYHGYAGGTPGNGAWVSNNCETITSVTLDTSRWYRVTVLYKDDNSGDTENGMFQLKIDGVLVTSDLAFTNNWEGYKATHTGFLPYPPGPAGTWFLTGTGGGSDQRYITKIAYQGTGHIDDLLVSGSDPFAQGGVYYSIYQTIGANITADNPTTPITGILAGSSTTITYTATSPYSIHTMTTNGVSVAGFTPYSASYPLALVVNGDIYVTNTAAKQPHTITVSAGIHGSSPSPPSVTVLNGDSTQIVFNADDWYRVATISPNGSINGKSGTGTFNNVTSDDTALATFSALATPLVAGVSNNWASGRGLTEADAMAHGNLTTDYLYNQNPSALYTAQVAIVSIAVTGTSVNVGVQLSGGAGFTLPTTINGILQLRGSTNLSDWAVIDATKLSGQLFNPSGNASIPFTDSSSSKFYRAQIVPYP
jgi:hypothetical protein